MSFLYESRCDAAFHEPGAATCSETEPTWLDLQIAQSVVSRDTKGILIGGIVKAAVKRSARVPPAAMASGRPSLTHEQQVAAAALSLSWGVEKAAEYFGATPEDVSEWQANLTSPDRQSDKPADQSPSKGTKSGKAQDVAHRRGNSDETKRDAVVMSNNPRVRNKDAAVVFEVSPKTLEEWRGEHPDTVRKPSGPKSEFSPEQWKAILVLNNTKGYAAVVEQWGPIELTRLRHWKKKLFPSGLEGLGIRLGRITRFGAKLGASKIRIGKPPKAEPESPRRTKAEPDTSTDPVSQVINALQEAMRTHQQERATRKKGE